MRAEADAGSTGAATTRIRLEVGTMQQPLARQASRSEGGDTPGVEGSLSRVRAVRSSRAQVSARSA